MFVDESELEARDPIDESKDMLRARMVKTHSNEPV